MSERSSRREKKKGEKPRQIITTGRTTAEGVTTFKTVTPVDEPEKTGPDKESEEYYASKYGLYQAVLDAYPDLYDLMKRAIAAEADGGWTDEKFDDEYNKTQFALDRKKAEEVYDLAILGPNADVYQSKVQDEATRIMQTAGRLGIPITEDQARAQATAVVRGDLPSQAVDAFFANQYESMVSESDASQIAGKPLYGVASTIQDQLATAAFNYGLTLDDNVLKQKTGEALGQGERWQEWVNGQEDFFREQAKLLYPGAANLLDRYSLRQIAEPYLNEAAAALGLTAESMDLTDTKWTGFLSGPNGIMSKDEWVRVIKTDPKYGWDKSTKARQEYADIGDELLAAFGMA